MKNRPMLCDYGITKQEYELYLKSEDIRRESTDISVGKFIVVHVLIFWIISVIVRILASILAATTVEDTERTFAEIVVMLTISNMAGMGEIIGKTLGFGMVSYIILLFKRMKIENKADSILEDLSEKKIEMLKKYASDLKKFENEISTYKEEQQRLMNEICDTERKLVYLSKNGLRLNTMQLKEVIKEIYETIEPFSDNMFDFYKEKQLIKCVGVDDFVPKIELNEMSLYATKNNFEIIKLYSLAKIDKKEIVQFKNIELIEKKDIEEIYNQKLEMLVDKNEKILDGQQTAQEERDKFWFCFDEFLTKMGEPFTVCHVKGGKNQAAGNINNDNPMAMKTISCEYKYREQVILVQVYINNDVDLFNMLQEQKAAIEQKLGYEVEWVEFGKRSSSVRRIQKSFDISRETKYEEIVDYIYPYILDFIRVFSRFLED